MEEAVGELAQVKRKLAEVTFNFSQMEGSGDGEWVREYDDETESHLWRNDKTEEAISEKVRA